MKHSRGIFALTSALALCLSACTVTVEARSSGSSPSPAGGGSVGSSTPSPAPTPAQTSPAGAVATSDLANILARADYPSGIDLQVIPSITLNKALSQAKNLLKGVKTDPEVCAELTQTAMSRSTSGFNLAVAISEPTKSPQISVGLLSSADPSALDRQISDDKAQVTLCKTATMTVQGVTISLKAVEVSSATRLPGAYSYATTMTLPGRAPQVTVQTTAVVSGLMVRASVIGDDATQGASEAGQLVDAVAAAVTGPNS
ncbi:MULTISPECIES: hypothetical protein [Arthrobacter]|uniref:PknH-like extracellular domain-containing protein n=2 Tax=Arthrobacter TaxID=1663 RepID=A0ABU9KNZ4_9MICC|nr:hypothetical protein [Arthrobacter sp. YJM1]MDP5227813.1 hypothetical protein [Arthrobacter sp. YJM1]